MKNAVAQEDVIGEYLKGHSLQIFEAGTALLNQGHIPEGCYILVHGEVKALVHEDELERSSFLNVVLHEGDVLGAKELFSQTPLAYSCIADTEVSAYFLSHADIQKVVQEQPAFYEVLIRAMAKQFSFLEQVQIDQALASAPITEVDFMVSKARAAHLDIQDLPESTIDETIQAVADAVAAQAENLAKLTVAESNMGVAAHKIEKIKLGTIAVAEDLMGKPGVGSVIEEREHVKGVAHPMGVVFAMIPVTNPVETLTFKFLISLKSRNAVIMSSHRKARNVGNQTIQIIQSVLKEKGLPVDLVQASQLPANRALTNAFMTHPDVNFILATGGPSMVKSAYQSGTPAIGVGKGNAPVWITADCNLEKAANDVIFSKSFDNGIVCGSENNLLVAESVYDDFLLAAEANGAAVLNPIEVDSLLDAVFYSGSLSADWVGKSAQEVCEHVGIIRNYPVRLIMAPVPEGEKGAPLLKEKLVPILSVSKMESKQQALAMAEQILADEGAGHTAIVHSDDPESVEAFAKVADVSRVLVNTPGTLGCIGANNGLSLSWTLGCGTQGGGATSDNVSYEHLLNVKRIAYAVDHS